MIAAAIAALALGFAIQDENGAYTPLALAAVTVAVVALVVAVVRGERSVTQRWLLALLGAGAVLQFAQLLTAPPVLYPTGPAGLVVGIRVATLAGALATGVALLGGGAGRVGRIGLLAAFGVAGVLALRLSPDPAIDVVVVYRDSIAAVLQGTNPYTLTFPNIYGHTAFFSPGLATNERLLFGFQYPPLALLAVLPAQVLIGDYRYAHLAAVLLAGALVLALDRTPTGPLLAALLLFTPRSLFIVEQGWTEALMVGLAALVGWAWVRKPAVLPYAAGALVVSKQYGIVMAPLLWLLADRTSLRILLRQVVIAALVAAAVTLPWLVADPDAFFYSLVTVQNRLPFRPDGLTYLVGWQRATGVVLPTALGLLLAVVAGGLALWRAPRTAFGFAGGTALTLTLLFSFNRQAFANYYFFILALLWVGIAASRSRTYSSVRASRQTSALAEPIA